MTYSLRFVKPALKEWKKLDKPIQRQLKRKLAERLENPRNEGARLSGMENCYKIKLRAVGYRLVYEVIDHEIVVLVLAVGKRERNAVYKAAIKRV